MFEVFRYQSSNGKDILTEWVNKLRDRRTRLAIDRRIIRLESGNFGDHKYLKDGVSELRLDIGPGYRLYYARDGDRIILLLCGGDKNTQKNDIEKACGYWFDWQQRKLEEGNK